MVISMTAHISDDGLGREESVAEHTEKTTFLCAQKGKRCGLSKVMSLCGLFHDLGKNKQKFHDYLHEDESTRQKLRGSIAHASTGAKYIYDRYHGEEGSKKYMAEMISYAIAAHHGLFDCVDEDHTDIFSEKLDKVEDYDTACINAEKDYLNTYERDKILADACQEFDIIWNKIKVLFDRLKPMVASKNEKDKREALYDCRLFLFSCLQRLILSLLIDSDWEATSDFMDNVDTLTKQSEFYPQDDPQEIFRQAKENFDIYMEKRRQSANISRMSDREKKIFDARNSLQSACRQFARHPAGVYCLPIPTGGGKTLSGLAYALEYCGQHREVERVIYVSPYISITEQNARVFRQAIGNDEWILEHHSSVVRTDKQEDEDYRHNRFSQYDINWEEPFICTTFVQFMNTLFSDKSGSIRRMHRLANAIVIIDEVQSMPLKCIHTFNYMINFLNAVCNTNIILCTATQPDLEEAKCPICYSKPKNMIENVTDWFHIFDRVKVNTPGKNQKYTFESLGNEIADKTAEYHSILVVLNTKSAVKKLYDILREQNINTVYLTTNLCAEHRSDRIHSIKEILSKKQENIVVVSTNLIEAGVDISFECVYRSMTGLDSLAQTAGRCNRNGEIERGIVNLIMLEGENTGNMTELLENVRIAENIIYQYKESGNTGSLLEPEWMDAYYRAVYFGASDKMNFPIEKKDTNILELLSKGFIPEKKKNYMNQAYKTAGQWYRVIEDHSFGVIVPYKKGAELIDSIQKSKNMSKIKAYIRQAQRYTVNVRESQLKNFDGLIEPVSDKIPGLYMAAAPGAYHNDYGITPEWETLIF